MQKQCPVCGYAVDIKALSCPQCNHIFRTPPSQLRPLQQPLSQHPPINNSSTSKLDEDERKALIGAISFGALMFILTPMAPEPNYNNSPSVITFLVLGCFLGSIVCTYILWRSKYEKMSPSEKEVYGCFMGIGILCCWPAALLAIFMPFMDTKNTNLTLGNGLLVESFTFQASQGATVVEGTVVNTSDKNYGRVYVKFGLFDQANNKIGTAFAEIQGLGTGQRWKFQATGTHPGIASRAEVEA